VVCAQPKTAPEPFTFDPKPTTLEALRAFWWNVAVSPDGRTIVTAHAVEGAGEWWVWDANLREIVAKVQEPNTVRFVAFSPDGSLIATANFDNAIRIYDAKSRKLLAYGHSNTGGHTGGVNSLSFSSDGSLLATGGLDKTARVWDVAEAVKRHRADRGNQAIVFAPRVVFEGNGQAVYSVALSPNGKKLVTGSQDGSVRLWDVPDRKPGTTLRVGINKAKKLSGHGITVECVAFSSDGRRIASGSWDNTAKLYDDVGKDIATLKGHNRGIMAMAFSAEGSTLVTVSGDHAAPVSGEVRMWDAADGKDRGLIGKHTDMALGVSIPKDGNRVVTTGRDRAIRIWDTQKRIEVKTIQPSGSTHDDPKIVQALAYSADGFQLAVAGEGGTIAIWDTKTRKRTAILEGHTDMVYALSWSNDGSRLASASGDRTAIIWDLSSAKPVRTWKHAGGVYAIAISPDGKTVATGGFDKIVRLWDDDSGSERRKLEGHTASVRSLAFSANGAELASGSSDFTVRLWSLKSEDVRELRGHTKVVRAVIYLAGGLLASGGDDGIVRVWIQGNGDERHSFGPYPEGVLSLAPSAKGTFLAAGLGSGKIHLLDPFEGQSRGVLNASTDGIAALAVSPAGREMASGGFDRTVRLWAGGSTPANADGTFPHKATVRAVAVAPSGGLLATGDADGVIHLFDAMSGAEKESWKAHDGAVETLAFSADGNAIASGGADKAAKVWRLADRKSVQTFSDHPGPVRHVALSAKGDRIAAGSTDADVRIYELATSVVKKLSADSPITALQFFADGTLLTAGGPHAYIWELAEGRVVSTLDGGQFARVASAAGTADGKLITITGDPAPGTHRPEDAGFCRVLAVSRHYATSTEQRMHDTGVGGRIAVSPDGRIISLVGGDGSVRVWDWPNLAPIRKFTAHDGAILGLAISDRGEFVVTASADGTAKRWNASRGQPLVYALKLTDESKQAWFARISPDGKVLATGGDDKLLRLRDVVPGTYRVLPGEYDCTYCTAINKEGTILATGHLDGTILITDLKSGKSLKKLKCRTYRIWGVAFSPDGSRLISVDGDWSEITPGEIRIWDTATWKTVHEFVGHDDTIFSVAISPDGKTFASGSRDQTIRTWELATARPVHTMRQGSHVRSLAYTSDGKRLYSCPPGGRLHWWDPEKATQEGEKAFDDLAFERIRLSPDGKYLAVAMRNSTSKQYFAAMWSVEKSEIVRSFKGEQAGQINDIAFSPDGRTFAAGGGHYQTNPRFQAGPIGPWVMTQTSTSNGKTTNTNVPVCEIKLWNVDTGNQIAELPGHKAWLEAVQFTPDGKSLITAGGVVGQPGEIRLWDTAGLWPKSVLTGHTNGLTCARFSPDSTRLATGSTDTTVIVWDVAKALAGDASAKIVLKGHTALVRSLAWLADGTRLVSCSEDGAVKVWDPAKGEAVLTIAAHDRPVYDVAISPDSMLIATAAGDWKNKKKGEVRVWDMAKGTEVFRLPDNENSAWGVAFTTDGKLIVDYSDNTAVRVFDINSRKELKALSAPTPARGLSLSPDGKYVGITAQTNGIIKVWETGSWREAFELPAHPGKVVFTIDFATDRQTILTAGSDGVAVVWKIPGGDYKLPDFVPPPPPMQQPRQTEDGIAIPPPIAK
jgi:WD40 repeat protein